MLTLNPINTYDKLESTQNLKKINLCSTLTIEDKPVFDKYLKNYKFTTSEYSFTNLIIWRKGWTSVTLYTMGH